MNKNLIVICLLIIFLGGAYYFYAGKINEENRPIACTMEAKMCPDGSSVGRGGPNCEFALCPSDIMEKGTDPVSKINFLYPKALPAQYINPIEWPPTFRVASTDFFCEESVDGAMGTTTESRKINDRNYCKQTLSEGAAGSIYITYVYTGKVGGKLISTTFTLRTVQCLNYDDPQKTACQNERDVFDIDSIADKLIQSVSF